MDIVRIKKLDNLKANFSTLRLHYKLLLFVLLGSVLNILVPHGAAVALAEQQPGPVLIFELNEGGHLEYLASLTQEAKDRYYHEQMSQQLYKRLYLTEKVGEYLQGYGSPLAEHAATLIMQRNWKTIVALANAESSLCKRYPVHLANCWGVGGSNLWDMGEHLGEGIVNMNDFLNHYPRGTKKYSEMSFEQMNGLYKQPPGDHWVRNNQKVYNDLVAIEDSLQ